MTTHYKQQKQFMEACGQRISRSEDQAALYIKLVEEEFMELYDAWMAAAMAIGTDKFDAEAAITETVDGIIDSIVVLNGLLISLGVDGDEAWRERNPRGEGTLYEQVSYISGEPVGLNGARANDALERVVGWVDRIHSVWEKLQGHVEDEASDAAIRVLTNAIVQAIANLADMINALGIPGQEAWDEIWSSNMSKLDPETGKAIHREDGKILKPESYRAPDLLPIIRRAYELEEESVH
jgi:predicted HAD superfamily Cof-like phosphohydrolase